MIRTQALALSDASDLTFAMLVPAARAMILAALERSRCSASPFRCSSPSWRCRRRAVARAEGAVEARHGMVVAQEARAARIGVAVLERGGNAVDAAVATGFAMAVTYPRAGNIGGGGYMVIHLGDRQRKARATSPSTTARPRRRRRRATCSSTRRAMPIRASRATPRWRSACPARWRGWRWRISASAPAA